MSEKTVILSFRIPRELKTKLETRASLEQKTLTGFVRDVLSNCEGERLLESARKEFTVLESDARDMSARVATLKTHYTEMMETMAGSQKELLDEAESRRKRLKRDRTLDSLLMGLFCFGGALLASLALWAIQTFSGA